MENNNFKNTLKMPVVYAGVLYLIYVVMVICTGYIPDSLDLISYICFSLFFATLAILIHLRVISKFNIFLWYIALFLYILSSFFLIAFIYKIVIFLQL